jgi:SAM-dependent methyltransferase
MPSAPRIWHYGLMAEYWAEFLTDAPEASFYKAAIARFGQPVLDLACGAGRLMLPLLRAGIDVDGCDVSPDMIRLAGEAAARECFAPALYVQAMHELDMPRRYRTICICGGIGLAGGRAADLECLRRCHRHLEPGGAHLEKWVDGRCVAAENHTLRGSMYLPSELLLMLRAAGFARILVQGDYSTNPATLDHGELTFTAIR